MEIIENKDTKFKEVALGTNFIKYLLSELDDIYQRRLFLLLILYAQQYVKGNHLDKRFRVPDLGATKFRFHVKYLTDCDDVQHNTQRVAKSLSKLMKKQLSFNLREGNEECSGEVNLVYAYKKYPNSGYFEIALSNMVWGGLFNFLAGFHKVDIYTCLRCKTFYSMYIYSLIYDQPVIRIGINTLRQAFKLENKYKNSGDFVKHVLDPAKADLDKISTRSFDYEIERDNTRRGCPIKNIVFYGRTIESNRKKSDLEYKARASMRFDAGIQKMIMEKTGCKSNSIMNNMPLFSAAQEYMGIDKLYEFIDRKIMPAALRKSNPFGYLVGSVKNHLTEYYGYSEESNIDSQIIVATKKMVESKETVDPIPPESDFPFMPEFIVQAPEEYEFHSPEEEHEADMAWLASNKINPADYVPASILEENEEAEQFGNEPDAATYEKKLEDHLAELQKKVDNLAK